MANEHFLKKSPDRGQRSLQPSQTRAQRRAGRSARAAAWMVTLAGAIASVSYYRHVGGAGYPLDDSWIHLAFADNLAHGGGLSINGGEPTPGATSPLWVVLLAIGDLFGAGPDVWPWVLGIACLGLCGILGVELCRSLGASPESESLSPWIGAACGLMLVTSFPLVWSAAGAMEPPLFGAMLLATLRGLTRATPHWKSGLLWGIFAGLTANARPEGLLIIPIAAAADGLFGAGRLPSRVKRVCAGTLTATLLTLPYTVFCLRTTGRPFPNTYYAKTLGGFPGFEQMAGYLGGLLDLSLQLAAEPIFGIPIALAALIVCWRRRGAASAPLAGLAFAIALPLSYASMQRTFLFAGGAGNNGRYLFPVFPPLIAIAFAGLAAIAGRLTVSKHRHWPAAAAMVLAIAALAGNMLRTVDLSSLYKQNVAEINGMHVEMAGRLKAELPPGSLVAANDVGALAYLTDLRVLDLVGIISTDVLDVLRPQRGIAPQEPDDALYELLSRRRPAAIVFFPDWYPTLYAKLRPGLNYLTEIRLEQRFTAGGDRLVAYKIDWDQLSKPAP